MPLSQQSAVWTGTGAAARAYVERGFAPIPVPHLAKRAVLTDWPNLRIRRPEDVGAHFPAGRLSNIGLLLGTASNGLVDVDLDSPEALAAAPLLLPPTEMVSGRESAGGRSHWWYAVTDAPPEKAATNYSDPLRAEHVLLLELRSTGAQTVVPPSRYPADPNAGHPTAERCVWWRDRFGPPARPTTAAVQEAVGAVAAASLLGRYWPKSRRHACALSLAGGLLRRWPLTRVEAFVRAVCAAAGDEEAEKRVGDVHDTARRLAASEPVTGFPNLVRELGANGRVILDTVSGWLALPQREPGAPNLKFGGAALKPAPAALAPLPDWLPFPTDLVPGAVRAFVTTVSAAMRCDPSYAALPALAVCAGMIGATRTIRLKKSWHEPAILWTAVVGESGTLKTPPFKRALAPVLALQAEHMRAYRAAVEAHRAELRRLKPNKKSGSGTEHEMPPEPVCTRIFSRDTTVEALAGVLANNRVRLLLGRDELSGWLASFNQYKSKGGSDLANWLELHSLGLLSVDRKTGEPKTIFVNGVGVGVCGGIQPAVLRQALSPQHFSAGIPARLLFAYPPRIPKEWTEEDVDEQVEERYAQLVRDLAELQPHTDAAGDPYPVALGLAPEAKGEWVRFYRRFADRQADTDGDLAAAFSKLEGYAARFALVHHVCLSVEAGTGGLEPVTLASVRAGIGLAEWFAFEAGRVYQMLGEGRADTEARVLFERVRILAARCGGRLTARQLQKSNSRKYPRAELAEEALERLVTSGLGAWVPVPAGSQGGHPTRAFVPAPTPGTSDATAGGEPDEHPAGSDASPDVPTEPPPSVSSDTGPSAHFFSTSSPGACAQSAVASEESEVGSELAHGAGSHQTSRPDCVARTEVSERPVPAPVANAAGVQMLADVLREWPGSVAMDTETAGLDPPRDRVRFIQLAAGEDVALIDVFALTEPVTDLQPLFAVLSSKEIVGHNLQFDLRFLAQLGFVPGLVFDTMLASRVLHAGDRAENNARFRHGLADAAERELDRMLDKRERTSDWIGPLRDEQLRYAAADVEVLLPLAGALREKLKAAGLNGTAELEMRALPGVAWAAPLAVDVSAWATLASRAEADRARLADAMDAAAPNPSALPGMETRNWDSPAQVKAAFAQLGVPLTTTDDDALAGVAHPLGGLVREYRAATKRLGTYGRAWLNKHVRDGAVLPSWNQLGAESGRMSCSGPNLQQVPRGSEYRRCLTARPGHLLVKADYSQIELRIAAKVAHETVMVAAYTEGRDLHTLTASRVLGKPEGEVTKDDRQLAKAVNFGLLYGMGWKGLKQYAKANYGVEMIDAAARASRTAFFATYPGLRAWHDRVETYVQKLFATDPDGTHEVRTLAGRRRLLPVAKKGADGSAYPNKTDALNGPVQGTGADGLKGAIALLWERRAECPGAAPVLFCHDEIVLEVAEPEADRARQWLRGCMLEAVAPLIAPVPVEVEVTVGPTWGG